MLGCNEYRWRLGEAARWSVFDREGEWLGQVGFPAGFRPSDIGEDFVLGVWQDEYEVEHVQLYELIKPEG